MTAPVAGGNVFSVPTLAEIDVAIFGGGIAGLWLLQRLRRRGFDAALFESKALGAAQTLASQGIIHSGVKYTFDNVIRPQAQSLAAMPRIWMDCIAGRGEVDLRGTETLAPHQLLFTTGGLAGRVAALASKTLRSASEPLAPADYPEVLRAPAFGGQVFRLHEPVLETRSVVRALSAGGAWRATATALQRDGEQITAAELDDPQRTVVRAKAFVFTAGAGNEWFAEQLGLEKSRATQRRPLRMFMVRGAPQPLYAHCLAPDPKPRLTITTHPCQEDLVWYVGGNVAERAVGMNDAEALRWAYSEMAAIFPWLDWRAARWAIHDVDRAEPAASKLLPSGPAVRALGNAALAWPSKLALAPALAAQVERWLEGRRLAPSGRATALPLPAAAAGQYPWEEVREWKKI